LGRNREALPELEASLALNPEDYLLRIQLADVLAALGRRDEGMRMGEDAVALARAAGDFAAAARYANELRALVATDTARVGPGRARP
jgi:hypothetical protein